MKRLPALLLISALSQGALADPYRCVFTDGTAVETAFPCEQAMVDRFGRRVIELYPDLRQINTSPDYIKNLYVFAMAGCQGHFAQMTPEEIGRSGEPFFPWEMGAAMAQAAREVICPKAS